MGSPRRLWLHQSPPLACGCIGGLCDFPSARKGGCRLIRRLALDSGPSLDLSEPGNDHSVCVHVAWSEDGEPVYLLCEYHGLGIASRNYCSSLRDLLAAMAIWEPDLRRWLVEADGTTGDTDARPLALRLESIHRRMAGVTEEEMYTALEADDKAGEAV